MSDSTKPPFSVNPETLARAVKPQPQQFDLLSTFDLGSKPVASGQLQEKAKLTSKDTNPKDAIGIRKVPMSVVPSGVLMDLALAMLEGASKYGRHNYRVAGVRASVYYDAAIGHLMDWWEGDDIDADSGLSHVTKAMASLAVLRDAMLQGKLTDDRPPKSKVFKRDFSPVAGEIIDRYAHVKPHHCTQADAVHHLVDDDHEALTFAPLGDSYHGKT